MADEVMGEDHEHRDDAQQFDAGIPLPPLFAIREWASSSEFHTCKTANRTT